MKNLANVKQLLWKQTQFTNQPVISTEYNSCDDASCYTYNHLPNTIN